jgi:hypothetical protein
MDNEGGQEEAGDLRRLPMTGVHDVQVLEQ